MCTGQNSSSHYIPSDVGLVTAQFMAIVYIYRLQLPSQLSFKSDCLFIQTIVVLFISYLWRLSVYTGQSCPSQLIFKAFVCVTGQSSASHFLQTEVALVLLRL